MCVKSGRGEHACAGGPARPATFLTPRRRRRAVCKCRQGHLGLGRRGLVAVGLQKRLQRRHCPGIKQRGQRAGVRASRRGLGLGLGLRLGLGLGLELLGVVPWPVLASTMSAITERPTAMVNVATSSRRARHQGEACGAELFVLGFGRDRQQERYRKQRIRE